jgi:hypothetical protein
MDQAKLDAQSFADMGQIMTIQPILKDQDGSSLVATNAGT